MDQVGFQGELGIFPEALVHSSTKALITTWNEMATVALDWIMHGSSEGSIVYQICFKEMKCLKCCWRKMKSEPNWAQIRVFLRHYFAIQKFHVTEFLQYWIRTNRYQPVYWIIAESKLLKKWMEGRKVSIDCRIWSIPTLWLNDLTMNFF